MALLGTRLCEALAAAHTAQLVHRDVPPSNVIIPDGGGAMRGDLATSTAAESGRRPSPYMAPERRAGERITVAADLYGLGATLNFAATGQAPGAGKAYTDGALGKVITGLIIRGPGHPPWACTRPTRPPRARGQGARGAWTRRACSRPSQWFGARAAWAGEPRGPRRGSGPGPTAYALTRPDDKPTGTPTPQSSIPTSPVGGQAGPGAPTAPQQKAA